MSQIKQIYKCLSLFYSSLANKHDFLVTRYCVVRTSRARGRNSNEHNRAGGHDLKTVSSLNLPNINISSKTSKNTVSYFMKSNIDARLAEMCKLIFIPLSITPASRKLTNIHWRLFVLIKNFVLMKSFHDKSKLFYDIW